MSRDTGPTSGDTGPTSGDTGPTGGDTEGYGDEGAAVPRSWEAGPVLALPAPVLGRLLDAAVARTPDAPALVAAARAGGTRRLSHAALAAEVRARAAALRRAGVRPGDRVGLLATRDEALVPALLALLHVGAAYVPLDPAAPAVRWRQVAEVAALRHVVGPAALAASPALPPGVTVLAWEQVPDGPGDAGEPHDDAGAAAYVLFTSGSTGAPKGVVVTHANVLARVASYLALTDGPCRYLLHSSLTFDGAVGGLFSTLARGGCLVLPSDAVAVDPARAATLVAREAVTHVEPVPSWYAALLDLAAPGELASVRAVVLGGEVLPPGLVARHAGLLPTARLFNDYGPTETTVAATVFEVPRGWAGGPVPIGRPHANTGVRVLAEDGRPAAVGEVGSLVVSGPCVAAGYLGLPEHPAFGTDPVTGERTYVTGDLAAWGPDGLLRFAGRADRQVKVRGQRVEPDEVEATLAGVPGVALCAVEVDRTPAGPRLVAYASPLPGRSLDPDGLRRALLDRLPAATCPDLVVVLDALPLTAGGKVDRRALPAPAAAPAPADGEEEPRDDRERAVAAALAAELGLPRLGRTAGFLALGGTSLGAARVAARLRRGLDVEVGVGDVLRAGTPAALAALLAPRARAAAGDDGPRRRPRPAGETWRVPATPQQESFWLLETDPAARGRSNLVERLDLPVPVDPPVLVAAVRALVARHSALRTGLELTPDGIVQVVRPEVAVPVADLGAQPDAAAAEAAVAAFAAEPFDLAAAPLLRVGHVPGAAGGTVALVVHHAVADGWSLGVLVEDLLALLDDALAAGPADSADSAGPALPGTPALPPVAALEPVDHAEWLATRPAERVDAAVARAEALLDAAAPSLTVLLPYDRPRPPVGEGAAVPAGLVRARLDADLLDALTGLARRVGATPYHVLTAGLGALLALGSGAPRPLLAGPVSGRGDPALDRLVGCLLNVGLLTVDTAGDPSFADLVRRVAAEAAAGAEHEWLPVEVALRRRVEQTRALPVLLNLLDLPAPRLVLRGRPVVRHLPSARLAHLDLDLDLEPEDGGLRVEASFARARLDAGTVTALVEGWLGLLRAAVADPSARVSALPVPRPGRGWSRADGDAAPAGPPAGTVPVADPARDVPAGPLEPQVAAVFADLLGRPVGATESFVAAGGHSLLAARMVARLRAEHAVDLDLQEVLRAPTVREVAALVTARLPRGGDAGTTAGPAAPAAPAPLATGLSPHEADALLDDLDGLSDDEVEALLNRMTA